MQQAEECARYHINAGRSATRIVATDSVFLFKGQSETWLSFSILKSHKGIPLCREGHGRNKERS
ncbi:hypothetical protein BN169_290002 [Clostridioides difficile E16]|nr:hypothetical protein BN169_290002 [Clostridioides difficile E16]